MPPLLVGFEAEADPSEKLWSGQLSELVAAGPTAGLWPGTLQCGQAVRVPAGVTPAAGWGSVKAESVGYVRALTIQHSRQAYKVDFPEADGWTGFAADLQIDPVANAVRPGALVRVRPGVEPGYGWGEAKPDSVGRVRSCSYDGRSVVVNFAEQPFWKCKLSEVEVVPELGLLRCLVPRGVRCLS